ncbi:type VI secretion system baseplate subunit TssK [Litoribrevibacter euphylliae]|uniref:Type VI secretion system baseplate subunit TssK n=1 Tax=Litoribrevibacter euphylliae TaxID=1834034 RepID=A0ABV7HFS3_9GAMM
MELEHKIVWSEGMFIAPQHFQQQDRYFHDYISKYTSAAGAGRSVGLTELQIDLERLKIGKIAVKSCSGLFPDGGYFQCSREVLLDVPSTTVDKRIYLALPISVQGEPEYGDKGERHRYTLDSVSLYDACDATSRAIDASVSKINIELLIEGDDMTGMTVLPIARVLECREDGSVILDQRFIPACRHYGASTFITERLKEMQVLLLSRANMVVKRIKAGQKHQSEHSLLRDYLLLQTLNRYVPWFKLTLENTSVPTEEVYEQLSTLSAELCSHQPSVADDMESFQISNMHPAFNQVFSRLREQLSLTQNDSVMEFKWDTSLFQKRRLLRVAIQDVAVLTNSRFILCVESSMGSMMLAQRFPEACKLSANSQIAEVVRNSLSGVTLTPLSVAPSELKPKSDVTYFEIDTHHPYWKDIVDRREAIALHVDLSIPDLELTLYALG